MLKITTSFNNCAIRSDNLYEVLDVKGLDDLIFKLQEAKKIIDTKLIARKRTKTRKYLLKLITHREFANWDRDEIIIVIYDGDFEYQDLLARAKNVNIAIEIKKY